MSLWLFRAGKNGEYEKKFLSDKRVYITWDNLDVDLSQIKDDDGIKNVLKKKYPSEKDGTISNWVGQVYSAVCKMQKGDWIAIPNKFRRTIHFGEIIGDYEFDVNLGSPYYHYRNVKWIKLDVPRDNFSRDILNSFGAVQTICQISKNNAEEIVKTMAKNNWEKLEVVEDEKKNNSDNKYFKDDFLNDAFISEEKYNKIVNRLNNKKNIILQGAPGVGKSYLAKKIAYSILGKIDENKVQMIQFHQSYSYEDFIMGYRPNKSGGFDIVKGAFYNFCKKAIDNQNENYYFIIDEINRGNLSKIFGELMLLIECDKRGKKFAMSTVYSEAKFYIPENLFIIGLMNTADRSIALIDYALRRRFSFIDIEPAFGEMFNKYTEKFKDTNLHKVLNIINEINSDIENDEALGKGFKIGHSYFCNLENASDEELCEIIECDILPLLEEYWIENMSKVESYSQRLNEAVNNE